MLQNAENLNAEIKENLIMDSIFMMCFCIVFQVLVKALVSMDPGDDTEFLKKQFQEFMAGLISLPINIPGSRLHRQRRKWLNEYIKSSKRKGRIEADQKLQKM